MTVKTFYNVTKKYIQINELSIHKIIVKKHQCVHRNIKQHNWFIIIMNVSWAPNQHIIMISEGSCDTVDWSNDAELSFAIAGINLHFKIHSNRKRSF